MPQREVAGADEGDQVLDRHHAAHEADAQRGGPAARSRRRRSPAGGASRDGRASLCSATPFGTMSIFAGGRAVGDLLARGSTSDSVTMWRACT